MPERRHGAPDRPGQLIAGAGRRLLSVVRNQGDQRPGVRGRLESRPAAPRRPPAPGIARADGSAAEMRSRTEPGRVCLVRSRWCFLGLQRRHAHSIKLRVRTSAREPRSSEHPGLA